MVRLVSGVTRRKRGSQARWVGVFAIVVGLMFNPATAAAQLSSGIAGAVEDTTGAVLPGVTVEANSPALIGGARVAVTDNQGQYRILELRPGAYTVTFTLPGFGTVVRDGIDLASNFTASVNIQLTVGSIEESVTVSGAAPQVDVQNVVVTTRFSNERLNAVPSSKTLTGIIAMTPNLTFNTAGSRTRQQDVGGTKGEFHPRPAASANGSSDSLRYNVDGFETNGPVGNRYFIPQNAASAEVRVDMGMGDATKEFGSIVIDYIPKDGANLFSGDFIANGTTGGLQSTNLSDDLVARGMNAGSINSVNSLWDVGGSVGGPIVEDKLWFFGMVRKWESSVDLANAFYDTDPLDWAYVKDFDRGLAPQDFRSTHVMGRVTWQVSDKDRLRMSFDRQRRCDCRIYFGGVQSIAPAASLHYEFKPNDMGIVTWNRPQSNRLLFEGGMELAAHTLKLDPQPEVADSPLSAPISARELTTGARFRSWNEYRSLEDTTNTARFSATYVTGTHAVKVGVTTRFEWYNQIFFHPESVDYTVFNGLPSALRTYADPIRYRERLSPNLGIYAQDQWTLDRLTVNAGVRFDIVDTYAAADVLEAGRFVGERPIERVDGVPNWKNVSPRVTVAYDVSGDGRTAVKAGFGGFVASSGLNLTHTVHPVAQAALFADRSWADANGDFVPDCDFSIPGASGECGPASDSRFGSVATSDPRFSEDLTSGWGNRPYFQQATMGVSHQVTDGVSTAFNYYYTTRSNFSVTENQALGPDDFDEFFITTPVDARFPNGGGQQLGPFSDITPEAFGRRDPLTVLIRDFGDQTSVYHGIDWNLDAQFSNGAFVAGGLSMGRRSDDECVTVDSRGTTSARSPQVAPGPFCDITPPWLQTWKFQGSYPLGYGVDIAGTLQMLPGLPITASYVITGAEAAAALGRPLSGGARSFSIPALFNPEEIYEERINQFDLRFTKRFALQSGVTIVGSFDIYNAFNAAPVLGLNNRYGPSWLEPNAILDGRLLKFEGQIQF